MNEFSFSEWLQSEMEKRDLNKADIARMTGITPQAIGYYIRCERFPSIMIVNDILNALGKRIEIVDKE